MADANLRRTWVPDVPPESLEAINRDLLQSAEVERRQLDGRQVARRRLMLGELAVSRWRAPPSATCAAVHRSAEMAEQ